MNSTSHRGEQHAEQPPVAQRAFDSSMDLDAPSLSELAFHFDEDFHNPAFREPEAVQGVRSVTDLPERQMICPPAPWHPSPTDITSCSFMDFTTRDQLEHLSNKTLTSRHASSQFDCMPLLRSSCPA
ncbi:hypothetical protein T484DRAFT_1744843 [Baffinella frigidus]|nr:hypothetical protein T484DRAFT_1744843 [Cryptophyta sp. CCMP2293]